MCGFLSELEGLLPNPALAKFVKFTEEIAVEERAVEVRIE